MKEPSDGRWFLWWNRATAGFSFWGTERISGIFLLATGFKDVLQKQSITGFGSSGNLLEEVLLGFNENFLRSLEKPLCRTKLSKDLLFIIMTSNPDEYPNQIHQSKNI